MCHLVDYSMEELQDEDFRVRHTNNTYRENIIYNLYLDQLDNNKFILLHGTKIVGLYEDQLEGEEAFNDYVLTIEMT